MKEKLLGFGKSFLFLFVSLVGSWLLFTFLTAFRLYNTTLTPDPMEFVAIVVPLWFLGSWWQLKGEMLAKLMILSLVLLFFISYVQIFFLLLIYLLLCKKFCGGCCGNPQ